ncbi:MAG: hypothetical protein JW797_19910 [Bradymonadales bacterium]|nr:hypothetical protein [Bradymonadales bacterium]
MKQREKHEQTCRPADRESTPDQALTVEELEQRLAPGVIDKKAPMPPPYPPGADYGLVRRDNLAW